MLKKIGNSYNKEECTHNWEYACFCAFARNKKEKSWIQFDFSSSFGLSGTGCGLMKVENMCMWYECKRLTLFYNESASSKISTYGRVLMFSFLHLILLSHYMSDFDIQTLLVFLR